ncbi:MAG: transglycosylase domain-containing protein [Candidatus Saccharimonadales bacterium]
MKKSNRRSKGLSVYANLTARRRSKADARSRRRAEYLASLPKQPLKRLMYRLHPKRVAKFWFSKEGGLTLLKLAGIGLVILAIFVAALFAYYRRELDAIRPGELAKRVQSTVTKYYDRNGELLWEDKGDGDYKLVVESDQIAKVMKDATVAIEDKDFYKHGGISVSGMVRAAINNFTGGPIQGASTLTQQLIKQVFFETEAERNRLSISRKIKEMILAIEVERMYNKDQILSLYLNEVPYGGRRNGVQSASLTYFGKNAKDLTLPEAALIASIPQNPTYYNPYNVEGNKDLIARQHKVINDMQGEGMITKEQAEEAKKFPILDTIKPEFIATDDIKAPHFVLEVRSQLEKEFGTKVIRGGGLTVKTTLDYRIQKVAEESIAKNYSKATPTGADNMSMTAVDVPTGQILSMIGSHDFRNKEYGAVNAATSLLQPGSSIKPFIYANLFKPQKGQNFGAGSILADESIKDIYKKDLNNYDGRFFGAIPIREALGNSRNPPAVKAAYIGGLDNAVQTARDAGDRTFCTKEQYGLSAAIGSCSVRQVEHANAYATLARQGVYKKEAYVLEVKNAQGQTLKQWKDESKRVLDPQITYILSDILTDPGARARVFSRVQTGFNIGGVKSATKTGTTDDGQGHAKDSWMMSYTPRMAVGTWMGKHDGRPLRSLSSLANGSVVNDVQKYAHLEIFQKDGSWKSDDWFTRPAGIQTLHVSGRTDIYPSWYQKPKNAEGVRVVFDSVSKKKATSCTPDRAKTELTVQTFEDPVTKKKTQSAPDGYDANAEDDVHKCDDVKPFVSVNATQTGPSRYKITATVNQGTHPLSSVDIAVDGQVISSQPASGGGSYTIEHTFSSTGSKTISATVVDQVLYDNSATKTINVVAKNDDDDGTSVLPSRTRRGQWF